MITNHPWPLDVRQALLGPRMPARDVVACFTRTSGIIGVRRVSSHGISRVTGRSCVVNLVFNSFRSKEKRALSMV